MEARLMSVLGKRVRRLEGPVGPYLPPIAVVSAPLPAEVTEGWAASLRWAGRELAVSVKEGEPALLLEPLPFAWVKGDAERIWLGASDDYPHALIMSEPGSILAARFKDEMDRRRADMWGRVYLETVHKKDGHRPQYATAEGTPMR